MGLIELIFGYKPPEQNKSSEPDRVILRGNDQFELEVVGESYYQNNLQKICGPRKEEGENQILDATLFMEDNNPHDRQAVKVVILGLTVGYLRREVAPEYRRALRTAGHPNAIGTCKARIRGGWERRDGSTGYYGVRLDLRVEFVD